jgi:hypothetical protein
MCAARELIAKEGLVTTTKSGGVQKHPAVVIERDSQIAFLRAIRELDLDLDPPSEARRPPLLRSVRGSAVAS